MTIQCPKCGGSGSIQMPERLAVTLSIIRQFPGIETTEVYARSVLKVRENGTRVNDDIGITAVNNRLNALLELDLIHREGTGTCSHPYRWFPVESK